MLPFQNRHHLLFLDAKFLGFAEPQIRLFYEDSSVKYNFITKVHVIISQYFPILFKTKTIHIYQRKLNTNICQYQPQ